MICQCCVLMLFGFSHSQGQNENKSNWLWYICTEVTLLGYFPSHCPVSTSAPPLWQSELSPHFLSHLITAPRCGVKPLGRLSRYSHPPHWLTEHTRIEHQIQPKTLVMCSGARLGVRATPQFSPTLMNYTCLASHLPHSSLCNVSHAWRSVCMYVCLCGCIYI